MEILKTVKKRRPKKAGYLQWTEKELERVQNPNFLKEFFGGTVAEAIILAKELFPNRSFDSVRQKIKYLEDKAKK